MSETQGEYTITPISSPDERPHKPLLADRCIRSGNNYIAVIVAQNCTATAEEIAERIIDRIQEFQIHEAKSGHSGD